MEELYKPELLSPAGNIEKMKFAFYYGADGVYLGGRNLNLRANAGNFTNQELIKAKQIADDLKKNIYLTLNIYFSNNDFKKLPTYLEFLLKNGINKLIISDFGVINFINKNFKGLFQISLSTQANTTNFYAAELLKQLGIKRIILARELNLKEIQQIKNHTDIVLETFIHGAMCVSYSGRCLLSEYLTGRSANKGDCTQPCRWEYYLMEKTRENEFFPIAEDQNGTYILSSKDLMTLNILDKLMAIKIDSFKIEGRMKSVYYVANVTRVYRQAIDNFLQKKKINYNYLLKELNTVSHRPYFNGFFVNSKKSIIYDKSYLREYQFLGYNKGKIKDNLYNIEVKNTISINDKIEVISPDFNDYLKVKFKLYDKNFRLVKQAVITDKFYFEPLDFEMHDYAIIRKKA